jgi:hypothetical protein
MTTFTTLAELRTARNLLLQKTDFLMLPDLPLTAEEKNAKNENEFNPECPWLYADLVRN